MFSFHTLTVFILLYNLLNVKTDVDVLGTWSSILLKLFEVLMLEITDSALSITYLRSFCVCYFCTRCLWNVTTDRNDMAPDRMKEQSTKDGVLRVLSSKYIRYSGRGNAMCMGCYLVLLQQPIFILLINWVMRESSTVQSWIYFAPKECRFDNWRYPASTTYPTAMSCNSISCNQN
jgi:hypothetical protein